MSNSFDEAIVTLIPKPHKETTKKENYGPIFLMDIDAKNSIKYCQNESKSTIKKIPSGQEGFIPKMQEWFNI